uniref:ATP synthase F0 subunit 4 n=1 Tax=Chroomonas placoidea TaxID=173977 RepID=A0A2P1G806_9CRYP|nr:ATP synthase F0 subunit 4 [Chroomonas placoidea]AVM81087.1 ATP synthase F0 subunit 4 [Chroomonas placoidea]
MVTLDSNLSNQKKYIIMINTSSKILILLALICAKEILVFNEEILIVIAFSIFLYLVSQYSSSAIVEELDEKAKVIQNKFDIYKNIEEKTILHLLNYHNKRELLSEKLKTISKIKKLRMNIVHQYYKTNLSKQTLLQIEDTLNRFILNEYINTFAFQEKFVLKLSNLKLKLISHGKKK